MPKCQECGNKVPMGSINLTGKTYCLACIYRSEFTTATSEYLLNIWEKNDRSTYYSDAFDVIHNILTERGEVIPPQNKLEPPITTSASSNTGSESSVTSSGGMGLFNIIKHSIIGMILIALLFFMAEGLDHILHRYGINSAIEPFINNVFNKILSILQNH